MPITTQSSILTQSPFLSAVRDLDMGSDPDTWNAVSQCLIALLRDYYVHLPLKVSSLGIDPVQQALLLADDVTVLPSTAEFNRRLFTILKALRDAHTAVMLPSPWRYMIAFLPFTVEACFDQNAHPLFVTKLMGDCGDPNFKVGVEITHWNGVQIARYIEGLSWTTEGGNPYARIAIALRSLTVRALGYMQAPDEDWVNITYSDGQKLSTLAIPWRVYIAQPQSSANSATVAPNTAAAAFQGVNRSALIVNGTWKDLFSSGASTAPAAVSPSTPAAAPADPNMDSRVVATSTGSYGYIRIYSFEYSDTPTFLNEFSQILTQMPAAGLIIDVRDNPGGTIDCAEGLMPFFTKRAVTPEPVSFRNTAAIRSLGQAAQFTAWQRSLNLQLETGDPFSQGYPLTTLASGPLGIYSGPIVLIIDALCYSATEFFTAGMQDNGLATIIGVDPVTGGGGANVWTLSTLSALVNQTGGTSLAANPGTYEIDIALRRSTRVGVNAGLPVEGLGIFADITYQLTRRDVLSKNEDLIEFAGQVLAGRVGAAPGQN